MAGCYNRVVIIGRLGQDPELRYTGGGTAVANLSMATERRVKRGDRWEEIAVWVRVTVWGRMAETSTEYLRKGSKALVEGELTTNEWEDRDGNKRKQLEIVANKVVFLGGKGDSGGGGGGGGYGNGGDGGGLDDDDLPF